MKRLRIIAGFGAVASATVAFAGAAAGPAVAANTATVRDCSLIGGIDPDFILLSGATTDSGGNLQVPSTLDHVTIEASESSDPGDNQGHDTFSVTVSAPGVVAKTVMGAGTGMVILTVPLGGAAPGTAYTIDWTATFDNGAHPCPGGPDPQNPSSNPYVLHVVGTGTTPPPPSPPTITVLRETNRVWREGRTKGKKHHKHKAPIGDKFSFVLDQPGTVALTFTQGSVTRGTVSFTAQQGLNSYSFRGHLAGSTRLKPGRYTVAAVATNSSGQSSQPQSLSFTITK